MFQIDQDTAVAVLVEQVTSLKSRLETLEKEVESRFNRIEEKLDEAIKGRPTWAMVFLLTGLMTICTGLAVFILTEGIT